MGLCAGETVRICMRRGEGMREIKFRAWDKKNNRMIHFDYRDNDDYFIDLDTNEKASVVAISEEGTYQRYMRKTYLFDAELMQYTGLKDKNGREVYDGDIVKTYEGVGSVEFIEFGWTIMYKDKMGQPLINYMFYGPNDELHFLDDIFEVIGNIYENPELLNK